ncbi:MAG: PIG-L family deacetylase [Candidatus Dormibacteraeota bacterium]|nr:PIG-L family deacetylase [Candidatus Dormibacteraeota bacterium]MBO0760568.1 PIG-L family deacetylase [Candidatus Dormibacteraeota bacterium]
MSPQDLGSPEVLSALGHELRRPLTVIRAASTLLLDPETDLDAEARARMTGLIDGGVESLADLIDDLSACAELVGGTARSDQQRLELVPLVGRAVAAARRSDPDAEVVVSVPRRLLVFADRDGTVRALRHLVGNALRYGAGAPVEVVASPDANAVRVAVLDRGPGVSAAETERAFRRFVRLDERGGPGLGLFVARGLARLMGGDVLLEPRAGGGAAATLVLPRRGAPGVPAGSGTLLREVSDEADRLQQFERVLVVCAHPDDAEFGFGATVARLADQGSAVTYVVCTDGSQGGEDPAVPDQELTSTRYREQREAAAVLGVRDVVFLGHRDGHLVPDLELRRELVREIRRHRPDLVLAQSPLRVLNSGIGAYHPDHLAVGEATLQAVYPDSRNPRAFRDLLQEGLEPHRVQEVWVGAAQEPDHFVDVTDYIDRKIQAIECHRSQLGKPHHGSDGPGKRIRERLRAAGEQAGYEYAEGFRRLVTG